MKTVGILGGGQLGMLLAQSIERLGGEVLIYDPDPKAPACKAVANKINAAWNDEAALRQFVTASDIITYEFENVDSEALSKFAKNIPIVPSAEILHTTQNRAREKNFLKEANLPHVPFACGEDPAALKKGYKHLEFPLIVKSAWGGYDGKLQRSFSRESDLLYWLDNLTETDADFFPAVLEERIDLRVEVSCLTVRTLTGIAHVFPIFENHHVNHILDTSLCPARLPENVRAQVAQLALAAVDKLDAFGLLCTEFFIADRPNKARTACEVSGYSIYINEFAPRPHNSGHVTMSACTISQFDALARVLLAVPLTAPRLVSSGHFAMGNLLGDIWLAQGTSKGSELDLSCLSDNPGVIDLVLYGKEEARAQRKMGHVITQAQEPGETLALVSAFRSQLATAKKTISVN